MAISFASISISLIALEFRSTRSHGCCPTRLLYHGRPFPMNNQPGSDTNCHGPTCNAAEYDRVAPRFLLNRGQPNSPFSFSFVLQLTSAHLTLYSSSAHLISACSFILTHSTPSRCPICGLPTRATPRESRILRLYDRFLVPWLSAKALAQSIGSHVIEAHVAMLPVQARFVRWWKSGSVPPRRQDGSRHKKDQIGIKIVVGVGQEQAETPAARSTFIKLSSTSRNSI